MAGLRGRHLSALAGQRERYGLLLLAIVASYLLQGSGAAHGWPGVVVTALLGSALVLALWAAQMPARRLVPFALVAALLVAVSVVQAATGALGDGASLAANLLLVVLAPPAVVVGVVRGLRLAAGPTVQAVLGALCLYLLVGMAFALAYGIADDVSGAFFTDGTAATPARCLYFSFTTLTTVGYGDLTARTNAGHTAAVTEALVGQIYLVTVVSVIIGNLGRRRRQDR